MYTFYNVRNVYHVLCIHMNRIQVCEKQSGLWSNIKDNRYILYIYIYIYIRPARNQYQVLFRAS